MSQAEEAMNKRNGFQVAPQFSCLFSKQVSFAPLDPPPPNFQGAAHDNWNALDHALYQACWHCDVPTTLDLLKQGAKPDAYQNNMWGGTTLMLAAQHGNVELVRALLEYGASALRVDSGGISAGVWARRRKKWQVLSMIEAARKREEREVMKKSGQTAPKARI
jgi:hypothetical protein